MILRNPFSVLPASFIFALGLLFLISSSALHALPARIKSTVPEIGAAEVDPAIKEIRVTFDRDMSEGMSWTGSGEAFPPSPKDAKPKWIDKRTCAFPVKLEAGKFYRIGVNSTDFTNFQDGSGVPAAPRVIYFTTKGATEEILARMEKPMVILFDPDSGDSEVGAGTSELSVTFDIPMSLGMSWVGGGEHFPQSPEGAKPTWSEDMKTCTFPVVLKPDSLYRLNLNGILYNNFQSSWGVPLDPVDYTFQTSP